MYGLVIAAVVFLFYFLGADEADPLLLSALPALTFLWYWHWTWAVIKALLCMALGLFGAVGTVAGEKKDQGIAALIMLGSPIIAVLTMIASVVYIGAVYCMQIGIGESGDIESQKHLVVGGILYGIMLLSGLFAKFNANKSD